jgi:hypothetical protein
MSETEARRRLAGRSITASIALYIWLPSRARTSRNVDMRGQRFTSTLLVPYRAIDNGRRIVVL